MHEQSCERRFFWSQEERHERRPRSIHRVSAESDLRSGANVLRALRQSPP